MSEEQHDSPQLDRRALLSAAAGLAASVTALPALSAETERALQLAAAGGDDYQLCFTVPERHQAALAQRQLPITAIGKMTADNGVRCTYGGQPWLPQQTGYQHF